MDTGQIPLFAMLRSRLGYLSQKQQLIAQNVANADTPGFAPKDLKPFSFHAQVEATQASGVQAVTQPGHMVSRSAGHGAASGFKAGKAEINETTLDGNSVSLEDEMMKMSDARMNYDAAIGFYQKSMNLLRMAAKAPGR